VRAIDTNVVLRYLLDDVADQAERARRLIEGEQVIGVTPIVLAEVGWTLAGPRYRIDRRDVARRLIVFLARDNVVTIGVDQGEAAAALSRCARAVGGANFGDPPIVACCRSIGVDEIYSFDRQFPRAGMRAVEPPLRISRDLGRFRMWPLLQGSSTTILAALPPQLPLCRAIQACGRVRLTRVAILLGARACHQGGGGQARHARWIRW
jgi:predicted nucleic acid-binding protein